MGAQKIPLKLTPTLMFVELREEGFLGPSENVNQTLSFCLGAPSHFLEKRKLASQRMMCVCRLSKVKQETQHQPSSAVAGSTTD